jgi:2-polyprenyl-3-methyl-5-hydroxy-6-metoxy-1,4-benzoquinol methylase
MLSLKNRSYTKELLDADDIPFEDIKKNLQELNTINTLLGGHKITIDGIKAFAKNTALTICEVGCGGGDNLQAIHNWNTKNKNNSNNYIGIDLKDTCIQFAEQQYGKLAKWITSDYALVNFEDKKPDVIFSSLFCHHFTEEELVKLLQWKKQNSKQGFFINDLQRNTLAYYLIKWITKIFSKSYLVKNDAPVSVTRGFHKKEWESILQKAGISNYRIEWKWAFRYLIICNH